MTGDPAAVASRARAKAPAKSTSRRSATRTSASRREPVATGGRPAAARQALLSAARELFVERGYSATSVTDIVEAAGTSVGLLYYHFGNKEQIFIALWSQYQEKQEQATRRAVAECRAAGERDGTKLLLAGMRSYLRGAWEERDIMPIIHGYDRPPKFYGASLQTSREWLKRNRTLLSGPDRLTVDIASQIVTDSLNGLVNTITECDSAAKAEAVTERGVALIAKMLEGLKEADLVPPRRRSPRKAGSHS